MRLLISFLFLIGLFLMNVELHAQDSDAIAKDSLRQSSILFMPFPFKSQSNPSEVDTALAIQRFAYLINNDAYESLFLDPNRNTGKGDSGYDYSRTMNYKGMLMFNMYTIYTSRTDGLLKINYWNSGSEKVSLSRVLNVFF